jgi:hypothetical protein
MISRCSDARERTMNRSEWSSEKTTDAMNRGYRRTSITSIEARRTVYSIATTLREEQARPRLSTEIQEPNVAVAFAHREEEVLVVSGKLDPGGRMRSVVKADQVSR